MALRAGYRLDHVVVGNTSEALTDLLNLGYKDYCVSDPVMAMRLIGDNRVLVFEMGTNNDGESVPISLSCFWMQLYDDMPFLEEETAY